MSADQIHQSLDMKCTESFISYSGKLSESCGMECTRWHIYFGNKKFDVHQIASLTNNKECLYMNQIHESQVLEAKSHNLLTCDGLTTNSPLYALAVKTADCLPIMIVHQDRIFAIHAGWRGLEKGILFSTELFEIFTSDTLAFIGPHIQFRSFEVSVDVVELITTSLTKQAIHFDRDLLLAPHSKNEKAYLNLSYVAQLQLSKLGIPAERIVSSEIDTLTDMSWHSYRRDSVAAGRNVHLIFKS